MEQSNLKEKMDTMCDIKNRLPADGQILFQHIKKKKNSKIKSTIHDSGPKAAEPRPSKEDYTTTSSNFGMIFWKATLVSCQL